MTFRILSCDGGGIRGYLSSSLIKALNTETNGKLLDGVHGFAGTSTGGLISIALGAGVPIDDIVSVYATKAATIFKENTFFSADATDMAMRQAVEAEGLRAGPGIFECEYVATGLRQVIDELLPDKTATLGGTTGKMIAVNTAQLLDDASKPPGWMPVTLNNLKAGDDYGDILLADAALATSAAPTYFPPHQIGARGYFADGGTFANNPVMNAIEVALSRGKASALADIEVISFGTGLTPQGISPKAIGKPLGWGVTSWLRPWKSRSGAPATALLVMTMDLSAQNAGSIADRLLGHRMARINPVLSKPVPLDAYEKADYAIMDAAIADAKKGQGWKDAIKLIKDW